MSNNWNGTQEADPCLPRSVVLDTGKLSSRPAGSFTGLTASGFGSSTSCEARGCFGLVNFENVTEKLDKAVPNETSRKVSNSSPSIPGH
jgi:hypothetical protein